MGTRTTKRRCVESFGKRIAVTAALVVFFGASNASAQVAAIVEAPTLETLASTNIEMTLQAIGLQGEHLAQASQTVAQLTAILESINKKLALARSVKRVYEMLRDYSWEDLKRDSKAALYRALPELKAAEREWIELEKNGRSIENGKFWGRRSYKDTMADRTLARAVSYGYQSTLNRILSDDDGGAPPEEQEEEVTDTEKLVKEHFRQAEMEIPQAKQDWAFGVQGEKLKSLVKDAELKGHADLKIAVTDALSNHQTAKNTQFLKDAKTAEIAKRKGSELLRREADEALRKAFLEGEESLLEIGIVQ